MSDAHDRDGRFRAGAAADLLLDDYLKTLGQAARKLPAWQRQLFLDEVAGQIDADLAIGAGADLNRMRAVLTRLGDPDELVRAGVTVPDWPAGPELATVLVLLAGGVLVPVIGWLVGVTMLWASPRWRFADKLLATLVWPGGLAGMAGLLAAAAVRPADFTPLGLLILTATAGVPPVLVAVRLLHTARRPLRGGLSRARLATGDPVPEQQQ